MLHSPHCGIRTDSKNVNLILCLDRKKLICTNLGSFQTSLWVSNLQESLFRVFDPRVLKLLSALAVKVPRNLLWRQIPNLAHIHV